MKPHRQGDILFIPVDGPRKAAKQHEPILAYGEATGHTHAIAEQDLKNCDVYLDEDGNLMVTAREDVAVVHQQHDPINLTKGTWEVRRQRVYQPEGNRKVAD